MKKVIPVCALFFSLAGAVDSCRRTKRHHLRLLNFCNRITHGHEQRCDSAYRFVGR
ncbi:MAG: hypothetical protein MZU79_01060 [Anaerotruncus sp.]|nr:hypothetical protein [Anaerotruncus sp.]